MFSFDGKGALVIGAGQNIGRQISLEIAARRARVVVADINRDGADETAALIVAAGGQAIGIGCDVASDASVATAVAEAGAFLGDIDILVNNAGILSGGNPEDIPLAAWQRIMDVNLFGMIRANALVLPGMIARGDGYIVNTASFAGLYPFASSRVHYAASKAAVLSMSQNLAIHLMPQGIAVSCFAPGPVMTTSHLSMEHFSTDYVMRGPGSHLPVKSQEEVAALLADAMQARQVLILTDPQGFDTLADYADDPDDYIRRTVDKFARGEDGRPALSGA